VSEVPSRVAFSFHPVIIEVATNIIKMTSKEDLQERWRYLYQDHLPALAKSKDSVQKIWPVRLDHCFARVVLDNAIGKDKPWTEVLKQPAIRNMDADQLIAAIELAEKIATGEEELSELNEQSLQFRGKTKKRSAPLESEPAMKKAKRQETPNQTVSKYFLPSPRKKESNKTSKSPSSQEQSPEDLTPQLARIASSSLTPFRKETLSLLCQIPRGRYSTYGALSDHISRTSHKTCARAIGSAMRNNPFAPEVPCHRILAGDGSLGGFHGDWGEEGKFAGRKRELLKAEGVRFDSNGKVKGPVFREFT
jgi:O-6-methylguanine DNA methyltransferase